MSFPAASAVSASDRPDFNRVRDEALARLNARQAEVPKQLSMNISK